ncbi:hypothetical protein BH23PLA1_BH23PLA1_04640 [soil metagenome]
MILPSTESGGSARTPPRLLGKRRAVLIALALLSFGLEGCQALQRINPFGPCGPCNGFANNLFHRNNRAVEIYGEPGIVTDPILVPDTIIQESTPIQGFSVPEVAPPPGLEPQIVPDLAPIDPPMGSAPSSGGNLGSRGADRADYQAHLAPGGDRLSQQGRSPRGTSGNGSNDSAHRPSPTDSPSTSWVLQDLPRPPGAVGAGSATDPPPAEQSPPAAPPPSAEEPFDEIRSTSPPPLEPGGLDVSLRIPSIPAEEPFQAASGIQSFHVVAPFLAGGSFPQTPGWEYLVQNAYKTVLDLRPTDQIRPEDIAAIHHHGLRYVSLPIAEGVITAETFSQFEDEIHQEPARPLYFCDQDGARAAILWYIHRIAVDKVDRASAHREAQIVGPLTDPWLSAAENYLASLSPADPTPDLEEAGAADPRVTSISTESESAEKSETASTGPITDPTAWRPLAALFLTILVVPLAYWSRASWNLRPLIRASLEAPARWPRSLPNGSAPRTEPIGRANRSENPRPRP